MKRIIHINIIIIFVFLLGHSSCSENNDENQERIEKYPVLTNKKENYTLNDLISFSKSKYGFVKDDGTINEYYGDFDSVDEDNKFDFNVGCGSRGDIISVVAISNGSKTNCFDLYVPKGENYFGRQADSNKKVGELKLISEDEIHGKINLCLEENSGCCGEEGDIFILRKISTTSETPSNKKNGFTVKMNQDLPSWFNEAERTYMLNDDRIVEVDQIEYIGGYIPNKGEIFFIENKEIVFLDHQIKIDKKRTVITKTISSGRYTIKIIWDTQLTAGAYNEGEINLYENNVSVFNSPVIISGW